jgi:hypothetical protein
VLELFDRPEPRILNRRLRDRVEHIEEDGRRVEEEVGEGRSSDCSEKDRLEGTWGWGGLGRRRGGEETTWIRRSTEWAGRLAEGRRPKRVEELAIHRRSYEARKPGEWAFGGRNSTEFGTSRRQPATVFWSGRDRWQSHFGERERYTIDWGPKRKREESEGKEKQGKRKEREEKEKTRPDFFDRLLRLSKGR